MRIVGNDRRRSRRKLQLGRMPGLENRNHQRAIRSYVQYVRTHNVAAIRVRKAVNYRRREHREYESFALSVAAKYRDTVVERVNISQDGLSGVANGMSRVRVQITTARGRARTVTRPVFSFP